MRDKYHKLAYQGFHAHRLNREPAEAAYAVAWQKLNFAEDMVKLSRQFLPFEEVEIKTRDFRVAATIIQWLGSPVGSSFVDEVRTRGRKFLRAWKDQLKTSAGPMGTGPDTLDYLLHVGDQRFPKKCSPRDREVAECLMAWLDSPPGRSFVTGVVE